MENAALANALHILDVAAGIGGTTAFVLKKTDSGAKVTCVEPSERMRQLGQQTISEPRVNWRADLPKPTERRYDRVLCGAAIWQLLPLNNTIEKFCDLLNPGGALCFNIPGLYLGLEDKPGGGNDPHLLALAGLLAEHASPGNTSTTEGLSVSEVDDSLRRCRLAVSHWQFDLKLTQEAYRDWLKIPLISNGFFPGLKCATRNQLIDAAFMKVDPLAWRWECWRGWTAWKPIQ